MRSKIFSAVFTIFIATFLLTPVANAELAAAPWLHGITVQGVRASAGAWGTGAFNYVAGATMNSLLPTDGWLNGSFHAADDGTFGAGTGYKYIFQFYGDANNIIAMGIIKDPGAAPWGGLTLMVEGLGHGQAIGGYWPQNNEGFSDDGTYYEVTISWTATSISFQLNQHTVLTYPIDLSAGPSFSIMGCARMPGDTLYGGIELFEWRTGAGIAHSDTKTYTTWTSDNASGTITATGSFTDQ